MWIDSFCLFYIQFYIQETIFVVFLRYYHDKERKCWKDINYICFRKNYESSSLLYIKLTKKKQKKIMFIKNLINFITPDKPEDANPQIILRVHKWCPHIGQGSLGQMEIRGGGAISHPKVYWKCMRCMTWHIYWLDR